MLTLLYVIEQLPVSLTSAVPGQVSTTTYGNTTSPTLRPFLRLATFVAIHSPSFTWQRSYTQQNSRYGQQHDHDVKSETLPCLYVVTSKIIMFQFIVFKFHKSISIFWFSDCMLFVADYVSLLYKAAGWGRTAAEKLHTGKQKIGNIPREDNFHLGGRGGGLLVHIHCKMRPAELQYCVCMYYGTML